MARWTVSDDLLMTIYKQRRTFERKILEPGELWRVIFFLLTLELLALTQGAELDELSAGGLDCGEHFSTIWITLYPTYPWISSVTRHRRVADRIVAEFNALNDSYNIQVFSTPGT